MKLWKFIFLAFSCNASQLSTTNNMNNTTHKQVNPELSALDTATFGAGCFWCVEAVFRHVNGVFSVESGYMGGRVNNPTYQEVCTGRTGHAEVCCICFNPNQISYDDLLEIFWQTHDPTTLNRQGADTGTQYRSVIFYHSDYQKQRAEHFKSKLNNEQAFHAPVLTEISPASVFYKAEDYHQNFYNLNPNQGYCTFVITPKLNKFKKAFNSKVKKP